MTKQDKRKTTVVVSTRIDPDTLAQLKRDTGISSNSHLVRLALDVLRVLQYSR